MIYMFKVFLVVSVPVFGIAGVVLLTMIAFSVAKDFVCNRLAMRRVIAVAAAYDRRILAGSME